MVDQPTEGEGILGEKSAGKKKGRGESLHENMQKPTLQLPLNTTTTA